MSQFAPRLTAAQVILLAAEDIMLNGASEFSEWDLTVASWARDRTRFGLRGYDQKHPDHKRVMMEIMGQKPQNPLTQGLMEKIRPNVYRLTPLGRAMAVRLRSGGGHSPESSAASDLYRLIASLLAHPALTRWQQDPDQCEQGPVRLPVGAAAVGAVGHRLVHDARRRVPDAADPRRRRPNPHAAADGDRGLLTGLGVPLPGATVWRNHRPGRAVTTEWRFRAAA
jgi:hypothetical protein